MMNSPLRSTRELAALHGVKVLVYADAGAGKTVLCGTAPSPVILSAESGLLSLADKDLPAFQIYNVDDLTNAYLWVTRSAEAKQFATVCIDSISEIAEVCLTALKKVNKDPRQAYGQMVDNVIPLIRSFRDLSNKHVYVSAKMEAVRDDATGAVKWGPSFPGKQLGPNIPYLFDEVFHLGVAKDDKGALHRYLRTGLDNQYVAKDRSGKLAYYEPADLSYVFNKITGVKK